MGSLNGLAVLRALVFFGKGGSFCCFCFDLLLLGWVGSCCSQAHCRFRLVHDSKQAVLCICWRSESVDLDVTLDFVMA